MEISDSSSVGKSRVIQSLIDKILPMPTRFRQVSNGTELLECDLDSLVESHPDLGTILIASIIDIILNLIYY